MHRRRLGVLLGAILACGALIIAGSAGGRFRQNLYYPLGPEGDTDRSAPHNRLLNTIVNVMGVESDWFGLPEGKGGPTMQGGVYTALLA